MQKGKEKVEGIRQEQHKVQSLQADSKKEKG
jgi:hypothetical protein